MLIETFVVRWSADMMIWRDGEINQEGYYAEGGGIVASEQVKYREVDRVVRYAFVAICKAFFIGACISLRRVV